MKKASLIAILTSIMIMAASAFCFAEGGFEVTSSFPEDGQTNTSMENLGVKLTFSKPLNSEEAKKANADKFAIYDSEGTAIPIQVLFSDDEDGLVLVLADIEKGFIAKNFSEYKLVISGEVVDDDGDVLGADKTVTFKTYNQKINNMVSMGMMFVMFGGVMVLSLKQNNDNKDDEDPKDAPKEAAFNPYKEARKTGKTVEEVKEEQAKREAKEAKRKARKKKTSEVPQDKKIDNCAELLNNVYHVHAPAPVSKENRSVEALKALRKAEKAKGKGQGQKY